MPLELIRPSSLAAALDALTEPESLPLAGGTSTVLLMNLQLAEPRRLVSLAGVPGLDGVLAVNGHVEIGAMCTHHQLSRDPTLRERLAPVAHMFGRIGNIRVRSWATVGGNLAHADPAQDPPVLLSALEATALVAAADGVRELPVADLADGPFTTVLDDGELITAIRVPMPPPSDRFAYVKFLPRTADDYATVSAAVRLSIEDGVVSAARLVMGSVGPTPLVIGDAAASLVGRAPGDAQALQQLADAVRATVTPSSDARASREYRRDMAGVIAKRAVLACVNE